MPVYVATVEVWFEAESLAAAEVVSDEMGDALAQRVGVRAVTNGAALDDGS